LSVYGEKVPGKNILEEVLARAGQTTKLPPLHISLVKNIPPGSGLGGGSGNAAALLSWLHRMSGKKDPGPGEFGSDVPFLFSDAEWAAVSGRGEIIMPIPSPPETPSVLVAVPSWEMSTQRAFSQLDKTWGGRFPMNADEAEKETEDLLDDLRNKRNVGLLPNDFLPILHNLYPRYSDLFSAFGEYGANGWGITGSGSACFGLFYEKSGLGDFFRDMTRYDWIRKIFCLE
jgi:4-diphosphocytidyl-2-C-methyl-D-erythritol kinase